MLIPRHIRVRTNIPPFQCRVHDIKVAKHVSISNKTGRSLFTNETLLDRKHTLYPEQYRSADSEPFGDSDLPHQAPPGLRLAHRSSAAEVLARPSQSMQDNRGALLVFYNQEVRQTTGLKTCLS